MYEIYKLHMYLAKTCTVPTLYSVNIILNLERPINVRRYFDSRKYEKLTKKLSMHVKILQIKMNLFKLCSPQIRFCLFTLRPIASKQLNSLTTLVALS